ncbi:hypothetical protein Esti_002198 [Eimeria stiedai]
MLTEERHDLIQTPVAQQTKPVVKGQNRSPSASEATTRPSTITAQHNEESELSVVAKETSSAAEGFTCFALKMPERRLEYSDLLMQHRAPPARQPREKEQQIPEGVDERMSAAEGPPSPQQDKHYATLLAALKETLRSVKAESSTSSYQSTNASSAEFTGSLKKSRQFHGQGSREWLAQLEQYQLVIRIPFLLVRLVCHQHFDTWIAAKHALHHAVAPEESARELWLVDAPLELGNISEFNWHNRRIEQAAHQHTRNQQKSGNGRAQVLLEGLILGQRNLNVGAFDECKPELMVNQQASHAGRSTIASAIPSELKNPRQANAQLNAVATSSSSVQSPLDQPVHLQTKPPQECTYLTVATGEQLDLPAIIPKVSFKAETDTVRAEGRAAHADLVESLNQLGPQASALVRKQPKR